jgi:predicted cupin superfamily sugar epimerase
VTAPTAAQVIRTLGLVPHPEGGFYREEFRDPATDAGGRARSSLIYFLLETGQVSAWHRVDAVEIWLWHAGAPLSLRIRDDAGAVSTLALGPDLAAGERPHGVVPAHAWQSAASRGAWTLVSCVVAPAFEFAGFELEAPG